MTMMMVSGFAIDIFHFDNNLTAGKKEKERWGFTRLLLSYSFSALKLIRKHYYQSHSSRSAYFYFAWASSTKEVAERCKEEEKKKKKSTRFSRAIRPRSYADCSGTFTSVRLCRCTMIEKCLLHTLYRAGHRWSALNKHVFLYQCMFERRPLTRTMSERIINRWLRAS